MTSPSRSTARSRSCCSTSSSRTTDEEEGEPLNDALQHKAELPALWATLAALESVLTEPFAPDYGARVKAARADVVAEAGAAPRSRRKYADYAAFRRTSAPFNAASSNQI